jgi:protein-S-isoprenylcysteine O-methyltransferase Ste14
MYLLFFVSIFGAIIILPVYFLSVEHLKLQERFGKEKGIRIGDILGLISGWGFFIFWIGIWISPQPKIPVPIFKNLTFEIPFVNSSINFLFLIPSIIFILFGAWFGISGVEKTSLKVAEMHRSEKIVTTGVYSIVRHPQYLGGLLAHVGVSLFLSALGSLIVTPVMLSLIFLISRKEEKELIREFGEAYNVYKKKVPMLIPKLFQ